MKIKRKTLVSEKELLTDKEVYDYVKPYAHMAFKDMVKISHSVIEDFYNDYNPVQYKRTWGMKGNYLYQPSMKKIKDGYQILFTYSSDYFTTEHRSDEWAFDHSFVHGYHGGKYAYGHPKTYVPQMEPSPYERILDFIVDYKPRRK